LDNDANKNNKENNMRDFLNESNHEFIDISSENFREYRFPQNEKVLIESPKKLSVSESGHRIWDGVNSYFIPYGWIQLRWQVKDNGPHFVK